MFHEKFKDHNKWEGTADENLKADEDIAKAVKSSLALYQRKTKGNVDS